MKTIRLLLIALCTLSSISIYANSLAKLQGKVVDALNETPIAGAVVYINDLKISTSTNDRGEFTFNNLPYNGKFQLEVRSMGYKTGNFQVDLGKVKEMLFKLEPTVIESQEVIITGTPFGTSHKTSSLAVSILKRDELQLSSGNLIEAVAKLPGVANVSTGSAIAKPIIRGLGYNRVLTMVDGAREEGQQWGDEHGVMTDQFAASRVEVLKGPASLLYGSDALGGVINIIDDLVPQSGNSDGDFRLNYQTNNGLVASSLMWQGNQNGLVYRARTSYKNAYGFATPDKIVPNSAFNECDLSMMLGLRKTWGYSNLSISKITNNVGLVENGPDAFGDFLDDNGDVITNKEAKSRKLDLPFQKIQHYRTALNSNFLIADGQLKTNFAFQSNLRDEFEESRIEPGLSLKLNTFTYDVKYAFPYSSLWEPTLGLQGMIQQNKNRGEEFLVPDYHSQNIGAFVYLKRSFKGGAVNAGLRYDYKKMLGDDLFDEDSGVIHQHFYAFNNTFSNWSTALGLAYELSEKLSFKGNIGSGFRAPNIAELGANGKHEGTFRYEIGNSLLKQETSLQFDLGLNYQEKQFSISVNAFKNSIYNYIYLKQSNNEMINYVAQDGSIEVLPVYRFTQTNARLVGAELSADFHLIDPLHFESNFSFVKGLNLLNNSALPFIPAANWGNEMRYEPKWRKLDKSYFKFGLNHFFKQNRIDVFETPTAAYTLLNVGFGTGFKLGITKMNLWMDIQNLSNISYYNHLSRYKLIGIFNPGRNVSLGMSIPL